jgi:hypothetical protein
MPNRPSEITWEVMVDWDAINWAAEPDFSEDIDDISDDVNFNGWTRGKEIEEGNAPSGTHEIKLKAGLCDKYSIYNVSSPLHDKIRPWLPIRIRAIHDSITYPVFAGFISSIKVDPSPDKQAVYIYITDGTDLIARQLITQDFDTREQMSDGEAIGKILDAAGWSLTRRNLDTNGGDDLLNYPQTGEY